MIGTCFMTMRWIGFGLAAVFFAIAYLVKPLFFLAVFALVSLGAVAIGIGWHMDPRFCWPRTRAYESKDRDKITWRLELDDEKRAERRIVDAEKTAISSEIISGNATLLFGFVLGVWVFVANYLEHGLMGVANAFQIIGMAAVVWWAGYTAFTVRRLRWLNKRSLELLEESAETYGDGSGPSRPG